MKEHLVSPVALCICLLGLVGIEMSAQGQTTTANEWAWMGGNASPNHLGVYGQLGVPQAQNIPGGRGGSATWTDKDGNLWLFGGNGLDAAGNQGWLNDLWKYQPADIPQNGQWTWMSGSNTVGCKLLYSATIQELECGQSGVYGTLGMPAPGNIPGGREGPVSWVDESGKLWLFGGYGFDAEGNLGTLNDLWRFDPSSNQWTWISGSNTLTCVPVIALDICSQPGVYGTLGQAAAGNTPGSREYSSGWTDGDGNFWIFGGLGYDATGNAAYFGDPASLDDVWKFDSSTNLWTWIGGSKTITVTCNAGSCTPGQPGVYGTLGAPAASNIPGARFQAASWTDNSGTLWLFGGYGIDANGNQGNLNDVWKHNPTSNEWTWIGGSNIISCNFCVPSVYGTLGVPGTGNVPGERSAVSTWIDKAGNLWLFDGISGDLTGDYNMLSGGGPVNDLWALQPSTGEWAWMGGDFATSNCSPINFDFAFVLCTGSAGMTGIEYVPAVGNVPGARTNALSWTDQSGNFWLFSGQVTTNLAYLGGPFWVNDLWKFQPSVDTLPPAATPIFSLPIGLYASSSTLIIANGMSNASIYYTTDGATPTTASNLYTGPLTVASSETVQAFATAPGYRNSGVASATYVFSSEPAAPTFSVAPGAYTAVQIVALSDSTPGAAIYYTTDGSSPNQFGALYTGPITVSKSETINAFAFAPYFDIPVQTGLESSPVSTAAYTLHLPPPDFALTASYNALTILAGGAAGISMLVTPVGDFSSAISFSCSGLPSGASCSFSPSSVIPPLGTQVSTVLTISTSSTTAALHHFNLFSSGSMLAAVALCFVGRRKRSRQLLVLPALWMVALVSLSGCGTTSSKSATSIVTVTATTGSLHHTVTVSLTVD